MEIEGITILSKTITSSVDLNSEFKELFCTQDAKTEKGIVYFFMSIRAIPRVNGESNILYIGQTIGSLGDRYPNPEVLASNSDGKFYKYIIDNYGGLSVGYIKSDSPKITESEYFKKYFDYHLEYPPKSKVGSVAKT